MKLDPWESFLSTFKALVGIGILSAPHTYRELGGGLGPAIIGNLLVIMVFNVIYN